MSEQPLRAPFATLLRLTDFEHVGTVFAGWQGRIEQVSSGLFAGTVQIAPGHAVRAVKVDGNQRLRVRGRDASGMLAVYPLSARMANCTWNRNWLAAGQVYLGGSEDDMDIGSERSFSGQGLFVLPATIESAAQALRQSDTLAVSRVSTVSSPSPAAYAELDGCLTRLLSRSAAAPGLLSSPEGHRLEQQCLAALIAVLFPSAHSAPQLTPPARSRLLDQAEEFLRTRLAEPIGMIDLCREVGANERTLRLAFQERYGVGPMTYFRFLRLNAVRARLRADGDIAVADAAREFGFHHLGNFAADYRRLFGLRPSETSRP